MFAVTNLPSGHIDLSSKNIRPLASFTHLAPHGSGTHAPSSCFFRNSVSMSGLATGATVTFPPLSVVLYPLSSKYFLRDMSWVLPNCGEANFLPAKSLGDLIPESFLTTNTAPPLAAPDII